MLLGLEWDADERRAGCERGLHAALAAGDHGDIDAGHHQVARKDRLDERSSILEIGQVVDSPRDDGPQAVAANGLDRCAHDVGPRRRDRDVRGRPRPVEEPLDALGQRDGHAGVDRAGIADACLGPVPVAGAPRLHIGRRDAEQRRDVGHEREVAEQERREAGEAGDVQLGRGTVEAVRVRREVGHPRVEHPAHDGPREPALERDADRDERRREQAVLEHGRHPRPGVLRDEWDSRDPRREERRKRPARDDDRHAAAAEVVDLGRRPLEQLVVRPHALVGRPDPRDAADELRRPLLGDAVTDQVVGDAGCVEDGSERASVRRDCDLSSALGERSPDLEHPRDLGEEAAVREEADHPSGHLR